MTSPSVDDLPPPRPSLAAHPLLARRALREHLRFPDGSALLGDRGQGAPPVVVAAALGLGLLGGGAFLLSGALGTGVAPTRAAELLGAALGGGLVALVLTLPPLLVAHTLRGASGSLSLAVAHAGIGPSVTGLWLLASTPLLALYATTGAVGLAWPLLVYGLIGAAIWHGLFATVRRASRSGGAGPGALVMGLHFLLTAWTALVLSIHLA